METRKWSAPATAFVHPSIYKAQRRVWRIILLCTGIWLWLSQSCLAWKPRQLLRARSIILPTLIVAIEKRLYKPVLLAAICDSRTRIESSRHHNRDGDCTTQPKHHLEVKHPKARGKGMFGGRCRCLGNEAHPSGCNSCVG